MSHTTQLIVGIILIAAGPLLFKLQATIVKGSFLPSVRFKYGIPLSLLVLAAGIALVVKVAGL
jgi:hypothetical protein